MNADIDPNVIHDVVEQLLVAVVGRVRATRLRLTPDAVAAQELVRSATVGGQMIAGALDMRYIGLESAYLVSASRRIGDPRARALGATYLAAATVLLAAKVEDGVWELRRPPAPGERLPDVHYPLEVVDQALEATAASLLLAGLASTEPRG